MIGSGRNLNDLNWNNLNSVEQELAEKITERIILTGFTQSIRGAMHRNPRGDIIQIDLSWNNCERRVAGWQSELRIKSYRRGCH